MMSIRKMKSHKFAAQDAKDRAYIQNIRKEYGDETADILSDIMDASQDGKYRIKKDEHLSSETTYVLRDLGYSVVNGYSYTGWEECRINWYTISFGESRFNWIYSINPALIGGTIGIILILILNLFLTPV